MPIRAFLITLLVPAFLQAAPPVLNTITPCGIERGKHVELTLQGANLTPDTRLHLPVACEQTYVPAGKPDPSRARLRVLVPAATPIGVYPVRAETEEGISSILWLPLDPFPSALEVEDNNTPDKAQKLTLPVIVTGQCSGGDVDFYRFEAKKGERLVIESEAARLGSGVVPCLRLTDDKLRYIASDDSQAVQGDGRIIFDPPANGEYLLEFCDSRYRGGNSPQYRIKIGSYDVVDEIFPLGGREAVPTAFTFRGGTLPKELTLPRAPNRKSLFVDLEGAPFQSGMLPPVLDVGEFPERNWEKSNDSDPRKLDIVAPVTINSRLERKGDVDRFQLPVKPGEKYRFTVEAYAFGSRLDGVLRIIDQAGKQLALVDDVTVSPRVPGVQPFNKPDPVVDITVPADVSLLIAELRDQRKRGGINFVYRLTVEPAVPDFSIDVAAGELNVPRNGVVPLSVSVVRSGYTGPIRLGVPELPPDFSVQGGFVAANATSGMLTISAPAEALAHPLPIRIEGVATDPAAGNLKRLALHTAYPGRDPGSPIIARTFHECLLASRTPDEFAVRGPATLDAVIGYQTKVPVTLTRNMSVATAPIQLLGLLPGVAPGQPTPPNSISFQPVNVAANVNTGELILTAPIAAAEGSATFAIQGEARLNNVARQAFAPATTVNLVRPFTVETIAPSVPLPPGQTVAVKFNVTRRDVFKEPIQVRLAGLPTGVTLVMPLAPIAANQNELVANLKVDPKAAAAMATLTLSPSAAINGQTYNHPPVTVNVNVTK